MVKDGSAVYGSCGFWKREGRITASLRLAALLQLRADMHCLGRLCVQLFAEDEPNLPRADAAENAFSSAAGMALEDFLTIGLDKVDSQRVLPCEENARLKRKIR